MININVFTIAPTGTPSAFEASNADLAVSVSSPTCSLCPASLSKLMTLRTDFLSKLLIKSSLLLHYTLQKDSFKFEKNKIMIYQSFGYSNEEIVTFSYILINGNLFQIYLPYRNIRQKDE